MEVNIKNLAKETRPLSFRKHWPRNTKHQIRKQWILELSLKEFTKILFIEYILKLMSIEYLHQL